MEFRPKISLFRKKLLDFLEKSGREHLPWRKKNISPYEVWVSEVMLQQTQVSRVIGYYARFLKRFPTVKALAQASWEEFLPYYAGLGYYSRGRNMLKTAAVVVKEYGGKFPTRVEKLEKLPGIGPYTARAIASFAGGLPHLAWDTNLKRIFGRVFRGSKFLLTPQDEEFFDKQFGKAAKELNAAVMDFGSSICLARPKCEACMLKNICHYYQEGGRKELRMKKKSGVRNKKGWEKEKARAIVFLHENHRQYFSSQKKKFVPFFLPNGYTDRAGIKAYFQKKFGLDLAVRPPHRRTWLGKTPVLLVNAQILLGKAPFTVFSKEAVRNYAKLQAWK